MVKCIISLILMFICTDTNNIVVIKQNDFVDNKQEIKVSVKNGEELTIKLESKATGSIWSLKEINTEELKQVGEPAVERDKNLPGSPEFKVYKFKVLKSGKLLFELSRPFGTPDKKFANIEVQTKD